MDLRRRAGDLHLPSTMFHRPNLQHAKPSTRAKLEQGHPTPREHLVQDLP